MFTNRVLPVLAGLCFAATAHAADKPVFAKPADWVKPATLDLTLPNGSATAAVATLLADTQVRFTADTTTTYNEIAAKVQTTQGLQALGTLSLVWQPDTDRLVIHKLNILRDGKVIDLIATGPGFTTLRRENRLEEATLDGTLTAATLIEGLEVGDILDLAYSLKRTDPILKGWAQDDLLLNVAPVKHVRLRALWPSSLGMEAQASDLMPKAEVKTHDGVSEVTYTLDDTETVQPPKGAPSRYLRGREVQFTNFKAWSDVSALLATQFAEAAKIKPDSPLEAEVQKIASSTSDPKARAEGALQLVQDKVRYVLLALDGGGLKPASADLTWSRRFGDCKGKTVLLLGILHGLGIDAEPALVSTTTGDGLEQRAPLPSAFDHVLVRATIGGRVYWLDGTRTGDQSLDKIETPPFQWALPMRASGGRLVRLALAPLKAPNSVTAIKIDATAGASLPAPTHIEVVLRGDSAVVMNVRLSNLAPADLERGLREFWSQQYEGLDVKTTSASFDRAAREERLVVDGQMKLAWTTLGLEPDGSRMGWKPDLARDPGPHSDAPYAVIYPFFEIASETIQLPNKGQGYQLSGKDIDATIAGYAISRHATLKDGVFHVEMSNGSLAPEFPASEAAQATKRLTEIFDNALYLVPPRDGFATAQENQAQIDAKPETADEYMRRGGALLNARRYQEALADLDQAVTLDPHSAQALSERALANTFLKNMAKAQADLDAATKIDPKLPYLDRARGQIALYENRWAEAVKAYTTVLDANPEDSFIRGSRALAYTQVDDYQAARKDCDMVLQQYPDNVDVLLTKAEILSHFKDNDGVSAIAAKLNVLRPDNPYMLYRTAVLLNGVGKKAEAEAAIEKSLALSPNADAYVQRSRFRYTNKDPDGALSDAKQALALRADDFNALIWISNLYIWRKDYPAAIDAIDRAEKQIPETGNLWAARGKVHLMAGQTQEAIGDFAEARKATRPDGETYNNLCWAEATHNIDLPTALADCDAALKLDPAMANALDSRGFVLLRLGRNEEAAKAYDASLAIRAKVAASLYGRSLAERRQGHTEQADTDLKAALGANPKIVDEFKGYGVIE